MSETRRFYLILLVITAFGAVLRLWGVASQPPILDEVHAVITSENYMQWGQFGPTMPYHPNLRNILLYYSTSALGTGALGLRTISLALGILGIPLVGLLVMRLTSNWRASAAAAFFLALDTVHITFSRQAIQEVHTAFFFLLGTLLVLLSLRVDETRPQGVSIYRPELLLPLGGIAFGLGLASKMHALFPLAVCILFSLYVALRAKDRSLILLSAMSLLVLPITVFFLTYLPWFGRGYSLGDWAFMQKALYETMVTHPGNPMDVMVDTEPWQWFIKPFMGYGNFAQFEGRPYVTVAMGNPAVWLLVIPAAVYAIRKPLQGKWTLLALFVTAYLPMALSPRPIWVLSSIAVTPFAFGLVGLMTAGPGRRLGGWTFYAYLAVVMAVSLMLYPMSVGQAWDYEYLRPLIERLSPH